MKKTYIAPSTDIILIQVNTILSASTEYTHEEQAGTGSSGDGNGVNFSREGRGFFDE